MPFKIKSLSLIVICKYLFDLDFSTPTFKLKPSYLVKLLAFSRYTSIGSIYDTVPNKFLCISDSFSSKMECRPAHMLADGRLERAGRARKSTHRSHRVTVIIKTAHIQ
ncbi:uncharacterized protein LOC130808708 [Amaranthus tricolor]|uniref:uncharacterized protein LOC130808708 n=1 Tax=Amaranthus tricolor TaxID=29722 RepID=UPI00258D9592|nr:uncharacterized protein LOC130808708 [Amaranthus tricolor]